MKHINNFILIAFLLVSTSVPVLAHPDLPLPETTAPQEEGDIFRFLNLIDGTSTSVDVYRDDNIAFFGIAPQDVSAERIIQPGEHSFEIYAQNDDPATTTPLATLSLTADAGTETLVIAWVQDGKIALTNHLSDNQPLATSRTRVELLHLSDSAPNITIAAQNGDILFENTQKGETTRADAPVGTYQLSLSDETDETLTSSTLNASPGELETVFLFGINRMRIFSLTRQLDQHALLRFVNAALDLLSLDVNVEDGDTLIAGLAYVLASRNRNIESGTRTLIFSEAGSVSYTSLHNFEFAPNHYYTFVVVGNGLVDGSVQVLVLDWNWRQAGINAQ